MNPGEYNQTLIRPSIVEVPVVSQKVTARLRAQEEFRTEKATSEDLKVHVLYENHGTKTVSVKLVETDGYGADVQVVRNTTTGAITSFQINQGGVGYTAAATVTVTDTKGSGAVVGAVTVDSTGKITNIAVTSGGTLYSAGTIVEVIPVKTDVTNSAVTVVSGGRTQVDIQPSKRIMEVYGTSGTATGEIKITLTGRTRWDHLGFSKRETVYPAAMWKHRSVVTP
jgi:hypothetical protein